MASISPTHDTDSGALRKAVLPLVIFVVLGLLVWWLYTAMNDNRSGVRRPPEPNTQVDLLPPPPPPPPPPPQEQIPPEKMEQPTPDPTPTPAPEPAPDAPAPLQMDAAPSAGADAFGIASGKGGGMGAPGGTGNCYGPNCGSGGSGTAFSDAFYRRYLGSALEAALRRDKDLRCERYTVPVLLWLDGSGAVTRADLAQSTGNAALDKKLLDRIRAQSFRAPQTGVKFPQRTIVRSASQGF